MDAINEIASKIISEIDEDLEVVANANPELHPLVDNIKLNLSAGLANIRFMIQDKNRLRQVTIEKNRKFHMANGEIILLVLGVAKRNNSNSPLGKFSVVWGQSHPLNLCKPNILPRKTRDNSTLLGLLGALNQIGPLGFQKVKIMTTNQNLKTTVSNIELSHLDNYLDDSREPLPDADLLKMIREKIKANNIKISFFLFQPPSPLDGLYRTFLEVGRSMMGDI